MKNYILLSLLAVFAAALFIYASAPEEVTSAVEMPEGVHQIIDNSCYGCHFSDSENEKGKKKLQFDKLDELPKAKLIGTLMEIAEVVEEDNMPPAKFLEFKPEAKLSSEQKQVLIAWAKETAQETAE